MSHIIGWICIGLAAALVAAIWPFRRGVAGFALNAIVAVTGAVGAGLLGVALRLYPLADPLSLPLAGIGAAAFLVVLHFVWSRGRHIPRHAHR